MSILESTIDHLENGTSRLSESATVRLGGLLAGLDRLDALLALPLAPDVNKPGLSFGRFHMYSRIGAGRFGLVLLAEDLSLQRTVVVKVPQPAVLADFGLRERFAREARASARLEHPGIVSIFETGEINGLPYLAAAFVHGPTLRQWRHDHPDPVPAISSAKLVRTIALAVHHAHERGVLHCDLAPSNVLLQRTDSQTENTNSRDLSDFTPLITDFGLARLMDEDPALTQTFQVAGTPLYMSPEQARGDRRNLTASTDLYALGVLLYDLLVGNPPFVSTSTSSLTHQVQNEIPVAPKLRVHNVPPDLDAICLKCLEKNPQDRYPSALALAEDLDRFLSGAPVAARPIPPSVRVARWAARNSLAAATLVFAVSLVVVALSVAIDRWLKETKAQADLVIALVERKSADARAEALDVKAKTAEFYSTIERVRQRRLARNAGWSAENRADLRRVCSDVSAIDPVMARTEAAAIAAAIDLGQPRSIAVGFDPHDVAFDPSGQVLAVGGHSSGVLGIGTVRLINPLNGTEIRRLSFPADRDWERIAGGRLDGCWCIAFSPDGHKIAVGTRSGWIVIWDLMQTTSKPMAKWRHEPLAEGLKSARLHAHVTRLSFDSVGQLWSGDDVSVATWTPSRDWREVGRQPGLLARPPAGNLTSAMSVLEKHQAAIHPNGQMQFRTENGQELLVCRLDGHPVGRLALPDDDRADDNSITSSQVNPDGTTLVASSMHAGHLKLWDLVSGRLLVARNMAPGTLHFAMDPQGRQLAVAEDDRVQLFDIIQPHAMDAVGFQSYPLDDVDLTPQGSFLVTAGTCPNRWGIFEVLRHDLRKQPPAGADYEVQLSPPTGNSRKRLAISADGTEIVTHRHESYVRIQPPASELIALSGPPATRDIRFSPCGSLWAVGADSVFVWPNGSDNRPTVQREPGVASLSVGADGRVLVGRNDGSLVWYSKSGERVHTLRVTSAAISAVAQDGDRCLVGTANGEVLVLDGKSVLHTIEHAHTDTIWAVTIGPSGSFVTGSGDRQVRIWSADGREVFSLPLSRPVRRLYWIEHGRELVTFAEGERAVRRWHLTNLDNEFRNLGLESDLPNITNVESAREKTSSEQRTANSNTEKL